MNFKKKLTIVIILLIIFILLVTITIVYKLKSNEGSYYETYTGTIEEIDDNRINVSVLEMQSIGFSESNVSIEIYNHAGNPTIKSELSENDIIFIKERVWNENDTKFEYCLREGRVTDIEIQDNQSKYISIDYLVPKKCMIEKDDIKIIKNNKMDSINYSDLKIGDKIYVTNKARENDNLAVTNDGVVLPIASNTKDLKDVRLLQVLNK